MQGTQEEIRERFGENIVPLWKSTFPLTTYKEGYLGAVLYNQKEDKLLCYKCKEYFDSLSAHLYFGHKIRVQDFRKEYGLLKSASLVSNKLRKKMAKNLSDGLTLKHQDKGWEKLMIMNRNIKKNHLKRSEAVHYGRTAIQTKNKLNLCDAQIKERLDMLKKKTNKLTPKFIKLNDSSLYWYLKENKISITAEIATL